MIDDFDYWQKNKTFSILEIAARLHHRAVHIHPFRNGNGRWARMIANIYLKQNGKLPTKWDDTSLSHESSARASYIQALKEADCGDVTKLIALQSVSYEIIER